MKRIFNVCVVILLTSLSCLLVMSCNKNDDDFEIKKTNHLNIDGVNYDLAIGGLENYGVWRNKIGGVEYTGSMLGLVLVSEGIKLNREKIGNSYTEFIFDGSGQCMYLYLTSSQGSGLDNGVYNCVQESAGHLGLKSFLGDYYINWKKNDYANSQRISFHSGDILVNKTNNIYEIVINSTDIKGRIIKGYFKGELDYFNHVIE